VTELPIVAVVVVNWNRRDDTLACLASLQRSDYPRLDVIVVDNGSSDGSAAAIRAGFPRATTLEAGDNLGFVEGCNRGIDAARRRSAAYALLLNNDTEIAPDCVRLLVEAAESSPEIGVVGPTICYCDRPQIVWSAGGTIDWHHGRTRMLGLDQRDEGQFGQLSRPVDFVSGCALLAKMNVVNHVGPLDRRFFAYYEETEWCVRIKRAGFTILHVPRAKVWHKTPPASAPPSFLVHYYMTRNRLLFLAVSGAGLRPRLYTLAFEYPRTLASWTLRRRWRGWRAHRAVTIRAVRDYLAGRFGRAAWLEPRGSSQC